MHLLASTTYLLFLPVLTQNYTNSKFNSLTLKSCHCPPLCHCTEYTYVKLVLHCLACYNVCISTTVFLTMLPHHNNLQIFFCLSQIFTLQKKKNKMYICRVCTYDKYLCICMSSIYIFFYEFELYDNS